MAFVRIMGRVPSRALVAAARGDIVALRVGADAAGARGAPIALEVLAALLRGDRELAISPGTHRRGRRGRKCTEIEGKKIKEKQRQG
jgi:hypothetical protein